MASKKTLAGFGFKPISREEHQNQTAREVSEFEFNTAARPAPPPKKPVGRPKRIRTVAEAQIVAVSSDSELDLPPPRWAKRPKNRPKTYRNWFTTETWPKIDHALRLYGWQVRTAVSYLWRHYKNPGCKPLFKGLNESTVRSWLDDTKKDFNSKVKGAVAALMEDCTTGDKAARKIMYKGGTSIWEGREDFELEFIEELTKLRSADAPLNSIIISLLLKAFLMTKCPEVLTENGGAFEVSRSHVRKWMRVRLVWSYRKPTSNTSKLPSDWEKQGHKMILRIAYLVNAFDIPPDLVVNGDQTGLLLMPAGDDGTYARRGSNRITVSGRGDKRQVTMMVSLSAAGSLLPFQLIFKGAKKKRILPKGPSSVILRQHGFHMTLSKNHWSNMQTCKDYVNFIFLPWVHSKCTELGLNPMTQKSILLLDSYVVHKSREFIDWMKETHPNVCYLFVPANCTSHLQPCDVVLQRPMKCGIQQQFKEYSVKSLTAQMESGIRPQHTKLETAVGPLRNLLCKWLWTAWTDVAEKKAMLESGWRKVGILKAWEIETQREAIVANADTRATLFTVSEIADMEAVEHRPFIEDGRWLGDKDVEEILTQAVGSEPVQDSETDSEEDTTATDGGSSSSAFVLD